MLTPWVLSTTRNVYSFIQKICQGTALPTFRKYQFLAVMFKALQNCHPKLTVELYASSLLSLDPPTSQLLDVVGTSMSVHTPVRFFSHSRASSWNVTASLACLPPTLHYKRPRSYFTTWWNFPWNVGDISHLVLRVLFNIALITFSYIYIFF